MLNQLVGSPMSLHSDLSCVAYFFSRLRRDELSQSSPSPWHGFFSLFNPGNWKAAITCTAFWAGEPENMRSAFDANWIQKRSASNPILRRASVQRCRQPSESKPGCWPGCIAASAAILGLMGSMRRIGVLFLRCPRSLDIFQ